MTVVSPSRLAEWGECALKYRLHYHDHVVASPGARSLYGRVVHRALDDWYAGGGDLREMVEAGWREEARTDDAVRHFVQQYEALGVQARALEQEIRERRPEIRVPRRTKDFLDSDVAKAIQELKFEVLTLQASSRYRFSASESLADLYDRSLREAPVYQAARTGLLTPYVREFEYRVEWGGFQLVGRIDRVVPIVDRASGELLGTGVVDLKTGEDKGQAHKHLNQLVCYEIAIRQMVQDGRLSHTMLNPDLPIYVGIDWWCDPHWTWYRVGPVQRARLRAELEAFRRGLEAEAFVPASRSRGCDLCDYQDACASYHGAEEAGWISDLLACA